MSVVIACKYNNGVILCSDRQITQNYRMKREDSTSKIKRIEGADIAIGGVGALKELQNMKKISQDLFKDVNCKLTEEVCLSLVDKIGPLYVTRKWIEPASPLSSLDGSYLFCDAYNINYIGSDLCVIGNNDYYVIGCGYELVEGYLNNVFKKASPGNFNKYEILDVLENAIKVACKDDCYIDDNIDSIVLMKASRDLVDNDPSFSIVTKCKKVIIDDKFVCRKKNKNCKECKDSINYLVSKETHNIESIWSNDI